MRRVLDRILRTPWRDGALDVLEALGRRPHIRDFKEIHAYRETRDGSFVCAFAGPRFESEDGARRARVLPVPRLTVLSMDRHGMIRLLSCDVGWHLVHPRRVAARTVELVEALEPSAFPSNGVEAVFGGETVTLADRTTYENLRLVRRGASALGCYSWALDEFVGRNEGVDRALMRSIVRSDPRADATRFEALAATHRDRIWLLGVARERPWLAASCPDALAGVDDETAAAGPLVTHERLARLLSRDRWPASARAVKWADAFVAANPDVLAPSATLVSLVAALPPSWAPTDPTDAAALDQASTVLSAMCVDGSGAAAALLSSSRGRFSEFFRRVDSAASKARAGHAPPRFRLRRHPLSDCLDFLDHVRSHLVEPFVDRDAGSPESRLTVARRIVTEGGLVAMAERSARWHAMEHPPRTFEHESAPPWPGCVPDFEAADGIVVRELLSDRSLAAEGAFLNHCVGGYGGRCRSGSSRIFSVRRDGAPISTFQAAFERTPFEVRILQHRGRWNAVPDEASLDAEASWMTALSSRTLACDFAALEPVDGRTRAERRYVLDGFGPAPFRSLVRRDLASLSWEGFGAAVAAMHAETIGGGAA